jgi:hypothetical protein
MSRPDPAPRRGGELDPLAKLRTKGMKKAPSRSVIEEMGAAAEPSPPVSTLHAVPSVKSEPEPVPGPAAESARPTYQQEQPVQPIPAPEPPRGADPEPSEPEVAQQSAEPASVSAQKKLKKTGYWEPPEFGERMRAAFIDTSLAEGHETLSAFICAVLEREVERLEEKYNGGERYRKGSRGVRRGRPVGS